MQCYVPYLSGIQLFAAPSGDNSSKRSSQQQQRPSSSLSDNSTSHHLYTSLNQYHHNNTAIATNVDGTRSGRDMCENNTSDDEHDNGHTHHRHTHHHHRHGSPNQSEAASHTSSTANDSSTALSSGTPSRASSATGGDSDSEGTTTIDNHLQKDNTSQQQQQPQPKRSGSSNSTSVLKKQQSLGEPSQILFQYFEAEGPHLRPPFSQRIDELSLAYPDLQQLTTTDLHPASWFAVAWYPLYRIPAVSDPTNNRDLQASFLTFHSIALNTTNSTHSNSTDSQRDNSTSITNTSSTRLPGQVPPIPPPLCPAGAMVINGRREYLRQQLVSQAVANLMLRSSKDNDDGDGTHSNAADTLDHHHRLHHHQDEVLLPESVHCLQPWAFAHYKATGKLWSDPANRYIQHMPMMAAAEAWTERRGVHLPDLVFFKRSALQQDRHSNR